MRCWKERACSGNAEQFVPVLRLGRFERGAVEFYGVVLDGGVVDLRARKLLSERELPALLADASAMAKLESGINGMSADYGLDDVSFMPFLPCPEKILCIGVNYGARNEEYRDNSVQASYPSVFMRTPDSFAGHLQPLHRPRESEQLDYEGELVIVIGRGGRRIARECAHECIAGLTLCNEGTVRDWVRHAKFNVTQGKNFERSGALGPWLVPASAFATYDDLVIQTRVNGELRQDDSTRNMLFPFSYLINYLSTFTALKAGDLIITGTPTGAGARFQPPRYLCPGDVVEVSNPVIGTLRNTVRDEADD